MMCGLPAVVSNVGDLGDLVNNGHNGFLIDERDAKAFSERYIELLTDEQKLNTFSERSIDRTQTLKVPAVAQQWDLLLTIGDRY